MGTNVVYMMEKRFSGLRVGMQRNTDVSPWAGGILKRRVLCSSTIFGRALCT